MNSFARLSAYGAIAVLFGAGAFVAGSAVDVPTAPLAPSTPSGAAGHTQKRSTGVVDKTAQVTALTTGSTLAPSPAPAVGDAAELGVGGH